MSAPEKDRTLDVDAVRELMREAMRWVKPKKEGLKNRLLAGVKSVVTEFQYGGNIEERRHSVRLPCDYPVTCVGEGRHFKASVINIGLPGLALRVSEALKPGSLVVVSPQAPGGTQGYDSVHCRVRWCKLEPKGDKYRVGANFEGTPSQLGSTWVAPLLASLGFRKSMVYQRRKAIRARARLPGAVSLGDRTVEVMVHNLSIGGALLGAETPLADGSFLELTFDPPGQDPLTLSARIVSAGEDGAEYYVGIEFTRMDSVLSQRLGAFVAGLLKPK